MIPRHSTPNYSLYFPKNRQYKPSFELFHGFGDLWQGMQFSKEIQKSHEMGEKGLIKAKTGNFPVTKKVVCGRQKNF